ncbi:hypothetical protein K2X40_00910 [Candidatus Babeliales bacterium]|nr:hypothetical protein [Candidatus Babeliales bacterium]
MKRVMLLAVSLLSFQAQAATPVEAQVAALMQDSELMETCLVLYKNGETPEQILEQLLQHDNKQAHVVHGMTQAAFDTAIAAILAGFFGFVGGMFTVWGIHEVVNARGQDERPRQPMTYDMEQRRWVAAPNTRNT